MTILVMSCAVRCASWPASPSCLQTLYCDGNKDAAASKAKAQGWQPKWDGSMDGWHCPACTAHPAATGGGEER